MVSSVRSTVSAGAGRRHDQIMAPTSNAVVIASGMAARSFHVTRDAPIRAPEYAPRNVASTDLTSPFDGHKHQGPLPARCIPQHSAALSVTRAWDAADRARRDAGFTLAVPV